MNSLAYRKFGIVIVLALMVLGLNLTFIVAQDTTVPTDIPTDQPTNIPTELPTDIPTLVPTDVVPPTDVPVEPTIETPVQAVTPTDVLPVEPTLLPTATLAPVILPEPPLRLLVRDLLDSGDLSHWLFGAGWALVPTESGFALQGNSAEAAKLNKGAYYNVAAQMRFALTGGSTRLSLRVSAAGSYTATLDLNGVLMLFRGDALMASVLIPQAAPGEWRTLRLSAMNDTVRVAVNEVEWIVSQDSAPLPPGEVEIAVSAAGTTPEGAPVIAPMLADDFFLFVPESEYSQYPQPTSIPLPATLPPTAEPTIEVIIPTAIPTDIPTAIPTEIPTEQPTLEPTAIPTEVVTAEPPAEITAEPTVIPTEVTAEITAEPTAEITTEVTAEPTQEITPEPTAEVLPGKAQFDVAPLSSNEISALASSNDNFSSASTIMGNFSVTQPSNTIASSSASSDTTETNEDLPTCGLNVGRTVWYNFTPTVAGTYTISLSGSGFDTVLGVYTDINPLSPAVSNLNQVACNDDATAAVLYSSLNLVVSAAQIASSTTFRIQIGGYSGAYGNYNLTITRSGVVALVAPVMVSPATNTAVVDTTPELSWNAVANAAGYEIQYSTSATFASGNVNSDFAGTSFTSGLTLVDGTKYYWRVRTINANGVRGAYSVARNFTVRTAPPVLTAPLDAAVTQLVRPTFTWVAYPGATKYSLWLDATDNTCAIADPNITFDYQTTAVSFNLATAIPANFLSHGQSYFWCVAAKDTQGNWTTYSAYRTFTVNLMNAPAHNVIITSTALPISRRPTFSWITAGVAGAQYQLEVSSTSDFSNDPSPASAGPVILNNSGLDSYYFRSAAITTLSLQLPVGAELFDRSAYHWRIKVSTDAGLNFNPTTPPTRTFKVSAVAPVAPVLVAPATLANIFSTTVLLDWNDTTSSANDPFTYELEIANNSTFTLNKQPIPDSDANLTQEEVSGLTAGTYFWHVRTVNELGVKGAFSAARSFTVRTTAPTPNLPVNGVTVGNAKQPMSWLAYVGAKRYELEYSQDNTFASSVIVTVNAPVVSGIPTASLAQGTWYWRVRAYDALVGGNYTPYSTTRSFVVNIQSLPANNAIVTLVGAATSTNITFTWAAVPGASSYILRHGPDDTFTGGEVHVPSTSTSVLVKDFPEGVVYWQVQAINVDPAFPPAPLVTRMFTISGTAPLPPPLVAPANLANIFSTTVLLDWNDTPSANGFAFTYEVQIATNSGFTAAGNVQLIPSVDTEETLSSLSAGTYFWRVRTVNGWNVKGAFSAARSFTVRTAAPTPNLPVNGVTVTNAKQPMSWLAYAGAKRYELEYSQDNTFASSVIVTVNAPVVSSIPTASLAQGTWYWRVRAFDALVGGNASPDSVTRSFVVNIQNLPVNNAVVTLVGAATTTNITFSWIAVPGATGYIVRYSDTADFTSSTPLPKVTTLNTVAPGLTAGIYYWQVQAEGVDSGFPPAPLISRKLTITPAGAVAPVLQLPANNTITPDNTPSFQWVATITSNGAPFTYEIQVDTVSTFPLPLVYTTTTAAGILTDSSIQTLSSGIYFWRVRAINQYGIAGAFSAPFKFTVDTNVPAAPPPTAPINGVTVTTLTPTFTWTATPSMGFVKYDISYSTTNPPSDTPTVANLTVANFKPTSPLLVRTYYWKVRGYDAAGNMSNWSAVQIFKVGSAIGAAPIPNRFTTNTPTLTWGPVSWAQSGGSYQIQVVNNTAFTGTPLYTAIVLPNVGNVPQTTTITALADGTYYWRVRACSDPVATPATCGNWSSTGIFTVETAP